MVALGEGLGTGFWRLDNGLLNWLTVVPPETAAVRRILLPDSARRRTVARAVTDHGWLDAVREPERGVIVTAPGVLMRLPPPAVRALLAACAERFPGGALVFDAPPRRATVLARWAAVGPAAGGRRRCAGGWTVPNCRGWPARTRASSRSAKSARRRLRRGGRRRAVCRPGSCGRCAASRCWAR